jgi:hypothetical protein
MRKAALVLLFALSGISRASAQEFLLIETPTQSIGIATYQVVDIEEFYFQENGVDRDFYIYFEQSVSSALILAQSGHSHLEVSLGLCGATVRAGAYLGDGRLHVLFSDSEHQEEVVNPFVRRIQNRSCK